MHRNDPEGRGEGLLACLVAAAALSAVLLGWQLAVPGAVRLFGLTIDRLSTVLSLLVAGIGAVALRFSLHYLRGDPGRTRFLRLLAFTVGAAYVFMFATNLVLLFAAWLLTSLGLHGLLTHYRGRTEASRSARKKFLISRLGDLALVAAIGIVWRDFGTLDLHVFLTSATPAPNASAAAAAVLVSIAALTKSAQFPFHSWLPETMESPTPVSALMHAGVVNAGGALALRFAPLIVRTPEALLLLAAVGAITASLGLLAMWAQVKAKRTLAWSTVSQMGFMMVQCGLGAFPAALLHIVGHGCYKAWSFLRTGTVAAPPRPSVPAEPGRELAFAAFGTALAIPALALAARATGHSPLHSPGDLALAAIVAMAVGQVWSVLLGRRPSNPKSRSVAAAGALAATAAVPLAAFATYRGAALFLTPVLGELPAPQGPSAWVAALTPTLALASLMALHAHLPTLGRTRWGRRFFVHALHGFYFGAIADRIVDGLWRSPAPGAKGLNHA